MNLFYASKIERNIAFLRDEEYGHCVKVLRHKIGDEIRCTDGEGIELLARIHQISRKEVELEILSTRNVKKPPYSLHMAIAFPKSANRVDFMIEKLIEIGVERITPIITAHSERKKLNVNRYRRKIISASTQSLKYHFAILDEPVLLGDFLLQFDTSNMILAHLGDQNKSLLNVINQRKQAILLIGPEGDFSDSELSLMSKQQVPIVNLSQFRLRTETAAIVAGTLVMNVFEKL